MDNALTAQTLARIIAVTIVLVAFYWLFAGLFGTPERAAIATAVLALLSGVALIAKTNWLRRSAISLLFLSVGLVFALFLFVALFVQVS